MKSVLLKLLALVCAVFVTAKTYDSQRIARRSLGSRQVLNDGLQTNVRWNVFCYFHIVESVSEGNLG